MTDLPTTEDKWEYLRYLLGRGMFFDHPVNPQYIKVDRDNLLLFVFDYDLDEVEEVVRSVTTNYEKGHSLQPNNFTYFDFKSQSDMDAALVALTMTFGKLGKEKVDNNPKPCIITHID